MTSKTEANGKLPSQPAQAQSNADARTAERERIKAILTSDAATDRPSLAKHLALDTDMTPDQAGSVLNAAAPEGKAQDQRGRLAAYMDAAEHPQIGADASQPPADDRPQRADASADLDRFNQAPAGANHDR